MLMAADNSSPAWVILHGDTDVADLYWCGFDGATREHRFERDKTNAIKFVTEQDALRAGVGLTKGIRVRCVYY
jgi:hypothetical protein